MIMKRELEDYIQNNLDELDRKKPDPLVLNRMLEQLQPAKAAPRGILISFSTMRWAAACIIAIVCGFIVWQTQTASPADVVKQIVPPPKEVKQQKIKQQNTDTLVYTGIDAVDDDLAQRKSTLARVIRDKKWCRMLVSAISHLPRTASMQCQQQQH